MINTPHLENTRQLEKLYKYLNYEVSSTVLYAMGWVYAVLIPALILAATIFTPYMLYVLYKEERSGWIIFFVVIVAIPLLIILIFYPLLSLVGLAPFYFYCFMLRLEAKTWLTEMRARNELKLKKIAKENEGNKIEDWVVMK